MVNDVIKSILDAEAEADSLVKDANSRSRLIASEAEGEAKALKAEATSRVKLMRDSSRVEANSQAESVYNDILAEAKTSSDVLYAEGKGKQAEAVDFIVGRIIG